MRVRMCCWVGISTLPPMWPHFFSEANWSSKCTPAAPARSMRFMSSYTLRAPPKPASPSAMIGTSQSRSTSPSFSCHSIWSARRRALLSRSTSAGTELTG